MTTKTKGWSARRRAQQAANIRKAKPWKTATGPRTDTGKAASAQNALKSGLHTAQIKALREALTRHRKILRDLHNHHV